MVVYSDFFLYMPIYSTLECFLPGAILPLFLLQWLTVMLYAQCSLVSLDILCAYDSVGDCTVVCLCSGR